MLFSKDGQAAFRNKTETFARGRRSDRLHIIFKAYTEIRIMPCDHRLLEFCQQEPEVLLHGLEIQRLIRHHRVDAKSTGIGTAHAADHGYYLEEWSFL